MLATWIPAVTGVFLLLCALIFGVIAEKSRRGTLPRNAIVGIRLMSTMQSDEAWQKAHQKTWIWMALLALIFSIGGLTLLLWREMTEVNYAVIRRLTGSVPIPILIIMGILAHKAASQ